jgi:hypothetical protein
MVEVRSMADAAIVVDGLVKRFGPVTWPPA